MNILYDVGARDESPDKTGFAHLFEHLMFGGSKNIPKFDAPLELAGGENNAFTGNDITDYYITIPKPNLETAFWLESDRMMDLAFSEKSLEVQRQVVIEEFKQRYLNQPYGDVWLKLRPLAYKKHPYMWPTIGKEIAHIENATMDDVKAFYKRHYNPSQAIMAIAGDVDLDIIHKYCDKWFAPIQNQGSYVRNIPQEDVQTEARFMETYQDVPSDKIYKVFPMCERLHPLYHATDMISDILSNGESSRLYQNLVKSKQLFTDVNAYITGDLDKGLFVFTGKPADGVDLETADRALQEEMVKLQNDLVSDYELQKIKNKIEAIMKFSELKVGDKAFQLCFYELLGDANMQNTENEKYNSVTRELIRSTAQDLFKPEKSTTLYYHSKQQ